MTAAADNRSTSVRLRPAQAADEQRIYDWVNRTDSLMASLETAAPVAREKHNDWFAKRLSDPATRIWIVEVGGRAVGQVRLQDKGAGPAVAIYIDAPARGVGVATAALKAALAEAGSIWPGKVVIALVREENVGSRRLFERCGFGLVERRSDHRLYQAMP